MTVFGKITLVSGKEPFLCERAVTDTVAAARKEAPEAEYTSMDAAALEETPLAHVIGGSLFSPQAIVVIDNVVDAPDSQKQHMLQVAADTPDQVCLVLVDHGGNKGRPFLTKLKKAGVQVIAAEPLKAWEMATFVTKEAKAAGLALDTEAVQHLVEAIGTDLRALSGAIRQLASDYHGERVSASMVKKYFSGRAEVTPYAIADDLLAGRGGAAVEKLQWALETGISPPYVTGALASSLRSLGKYLDAQSSRLNDQQMAERIGVHQWKVKHIAKIAPYWSPRAVSAAIRLTALADQGVKGSAHDPNFVLEQLVLSVYRARSLR